jgi:hypothetical protein
MRNAAAVAVAGGALAAVAAAAPFGEDPLPTRDCGTRTEPTRGVLRFASSGDVVIGPVAFSGLAGASAPRNVGGRRADGTMLRKSPVKVLWGPPVVLRVAESDRADLALEYVPKGGWQQTPAVGFVQCPPCKRMWNGNR